MKHLAMLRSSNAQSPFFCQQALGCVPQEQATCTGNICGLPGFVKLTPSSSGVEKYGASVTSDGTKPHSTMPESPRSAFRS